MHPSVANIGFTLLIAGLVALLLYRRFRRNFGRQPLRAKRMLMRSVLLAAICLLVLASPYRNLDSAIAAACGALIGIALALWALAHTRFEANPEGRFYTPNGYIGMLVVALFLGRLIYRFIVVYPLMHRAVRAVAQNPQLQANPFAAYERSPLTLGLFFLLAGYYICYYLGVLLKSRKLAPADPGNKPTLIS